MSTGLSSERNALPTALSGRRLIVRRERAENISGMGVLLWSEEREAWIWAAMSAPSQRGRDSRTVRVRWRVGESLRRVRRAVRMVEELERVRMRREPGAESGLVGFYWETEMLVIVHDERWTYSMGV
jgi:hypothetical protein